MSLGAFVLLHPTLAPMPPNGEAESQGQEELLQAVESNDVEKLRELSQSGVSLDEKSGEQGETALHVAASKGFDAAVEVLLEHRADLELTTQNGETPLHKAAFEGHPLVVKTLVVHGANVGSANQYGYTPFVWAVRNGHEQTVEVLVECRADVESRGPDGLSALQTALQKNKLGVMQKLVHLRADIDALDPTGQTPVQAAAKDGKLELVKLLATLRADITKSGKGGVAPVHAAASSGNTKVLQVLVELGASLSQTDDKGICAWTIIKNKRDASVFKANKDLMLSFIPALQEEDLLCLVAHPPPESTWLHVAVMRRNVVACERLVQARADVEAKDSSGRTPWDIALSQVEFCISGPTDENLEMQLALLPGVASRTFSRLLKEKVPEGSWLHRAAKCGSLPATQALVEAGALRGLRNSQGKTPLDIAKELQRKDVVDYLEKHSTMSNTRVGSGEAYAAAMADNALVTQVEWFTFVLRGRLIVRHSFLLVTVQDKKEERRYVLEKAKRDEPGSMDGEQFKNGVHISSWKEVAGKLDVEPDHFATLKEHHLAATDFTMKKLRVVAVETGPYDLGASNCHHAARAVFNHCSDRRHHVYPWQIPNRVLIVGARALSRAGIDLESAGSLASAGSVPGVSTSEVRVDLRDLFGNQSIEMVDNCSGEDHRHAAAAAELATWIYTGNKEELPKDCELLFLQMAEGHQKPVQWALLRCGRVLFIVFKGTDNSRDALIDVSADPRLVSLGEAEIQVHGGMWEALEVGNVKEEVVQKIKEELAKKPQEEAKTRAEEAIVISGHSLGGGYAVLMGLQLLHEIKNADLPEVDLKVTTFGAPQVLLFEGEQHPLMDDLHGLCHQYIHSWDAVPRLPSLWYKEVRLGGLRITVDISEHRSQILEKYGHVGKLHLIAVGCRWASQLLAQSSDWRTILGKPAPGGVSVLADHSMGDAYLKIVKDLDLEHQPSWVAGSMTMISEGESEHGTFGSGMSDGVYSSNRKSILSTNEEPAPPPPMKKPYRFGDLLLRPAARGIARAVRRLQTG